MTDPTNTVVETTPAEPTAEAIATAQEPTTFDAAYVKTLREESKARRLETEALKSQVAKFEKAAQERENAELSENERLQKQASELEAKFAATLAQAETQAKKLTLSQFAAEAGLPPGAANVMDVNAFDLTDKEATLKTLSELKPTPASSGGGPSNPGNPAKSAGTSAEDWYNNRTGKSPSIFGG